MQSTILIVDDEKHTRDGLRLALDADYDLFVAADHAAAMDILENEKIDLMVTDLRLGTDDGLKLVDEALGLAKPPICILMTAYGSESVAVEAMKRGVDEYVTKPLNIDELEILIKRALRTRRIEQENITLKQQVDRSFGISGIVGTSAAIRPIIETIKQVAPSRATILVEGESGTGKELVAHAVHNLSGRPKAKLVTVHCAALSPQLLESELFGHERGAFTGATGKRIGRFELADGGTLFLDEIGEIDPNTQVKLLRAIGEQTIERVGSNTPIKVDVRVIAATNRDLRSLVECGEFREDLFFRLNVVRIRMPPLCERKEDIIPLAGHFLKEVARENGKPVKELSPEALQMLLACPWPGNIRELRTAIEHGVVMSNAERITPRNLPDYIRRGGAGIALPSAGINPGSGITTKPAHSASPGEEDELNLEKMEQRLIRIALDRTDNNRTAAAALLGLSRRTLQRKLSDMGLVRHRNKG
jgi:DNA-binding NtrC family response regulator